MTYEEFFSHPFLNLEYYPSEESFEKAVKIVSMAVKYDEDSKYNEAYDCYNKALLYLLPLAGGKVVLNTYLFFNRKYLNYLQLILYNNNYILITVNTSKIQNNQLATNIKN